MEINYKQIGALFLAVILTAGGTVYLERTGDYHNCRGLWTQNKDGSYTCLKDNYTSYCYEIESRGSGWYRCYEAIPVMLTENKTESIENKVNSGGWICNPNECKRK